MNTDNWLTLILILATVLLVISTLVAPVVPQLLESPEVIAKGKRGLNSTKLFFSAVRDFTFSWFPAILIAVSIYSIYREMNREEPITRIDILSIAMSVMMLGVNVTLILVSRSIDAIYANIREMIGISRKHVEGTAKLAEAVHLLRLATLGEPKPKAGEDLDEQS